VYVYKLAVNKDRLEFLSRGECDNDSFDNNTENKNNNYNREHKYDEEDLDDIEDLATKKANPTRINIEDDVESEEVDDRGGKRK
jgi:hypothetical protein